MEPSVLVVHEEHGVDYYLIPDLESLHSAAFSVLVGRYEKGWYSPEKEPTKLGLTIEQIDALPIGDVFKRFATQEFQRYEIDFRHWQESVALYANIEKAIETKDGSLAWQILQDLECYGSYRCSLEPLRPIPEHHG